MPDKLLVVSTSEDFVEAIETQLLGYPIITAHTMAAALRLLEDEDIGAILADHAPPDPDGVLLLRDARAVNPHARRLLLTGSIDPRVREAASAPEGPYLILKPWDREGLLTVVSRALEHRRESRRHQLSLRNLRHNINSCMALSNAETPHGVLRAAAESLTEYGSLASVNAYLLERTELKRINPEGGQSLPLHALHHIAVRALAEDCVTRVRQTGHVDTAIRVGGPPGSVGVIHAAARQDDPDAMLILRHMTQAASLRLRTLALRMPKPGEAEELHELRRKASLAELLVSIVNRLRNPLASILAHLELLAYKREGDKIAREDIEALLPGMKRVMEILEHAGAASHSCATVGEVDICADLRLIAETVQHSYAVHNTKLELDLPPDCPRVEGNADRLQEAWMNLLCNAFEAVRDREKQGVIRIKVNTFPKLGRITVEIRDNGPGMDGQIVQWLNAADRSAKPPEGMGPGMREVLAVIAEHAGNMRVTSSPGRGFSALVSLRTAGSSATQGDPPAPLAFPPGVS